MNLLYGSNWIVLVKTKDCDLISFELLQQQQETHIELIEKLQRDLKVVQSKWNTEAVNSTTLRNENEVLRIDF